MWHCAWRSVTFTYAIKAENAITVLYLCLISTPAVRRVLCIEIASGLAEAVMSWSFLIFGYYKHVGQNQILTKWWHKIKARSHLLQFIIWGPWMCAPNITAIHWIAADKVVDKHCHPYSNALVVRVNVLDLLHVLSSSKVEQLIIFLLLK